MICLTFLAFFVSISGSWSKPILTVYAPDYFTSEWGPGPSIKMAFEEVCNCDLKYVAGDLLPRLLIERDKIKADVVIGLNTDVTFKARMLDIFIPHGQDTSDLTIPIKWIDSIFLPFNWSHTAFIFDNTKLDNPPTSFEDLLDLPEDTRIIIQDPRTSISGLAFVLWVKAVFGDDSEKAFSRLAPKILTVTKGWSESYGMFTEGEADMVLSYTTSPAYHIIAEQDNTKSAAIFDEGHYFMAELVGMTKNSSEPELAKKFMNFILSERFQGMIPTANWSFPTKLDASKLPEGFAGLPLPQKVLFYTEEEAERYKDIAIQEWLTAFQR
jgi:thiamine transport system substrate-binding protein